MFIGKTRAKMKRKMVGYSPHYSTYKPDVNSMEWERLVEQQGENYSLDLADTLRSLRPEIRSCKADNNMLIEAREVLARAQEKKVQVSAMILQSLSKLQKQGYMGISHGDR